jgi:hypothetical protein
MLSSGMCPRGLTFRRNVLHLSLEMKSRTSKKTGDTFRMYDVTPLHRFTLYFKYNSIDQSRWELSQSLKIFRIARNPKVSNILKLGYCPWRNTRVASHLLGSQLYLHWRPSQSISHNLTRVLQCSLSCCAERRLRVQCNEGAIKRQWTERVRPAFS